MRLLALLVTALSSAVAPAAPAQTLGQEAAVFPFGAAALLADPGRARVYATVPATGSVAVINTKKLNVIATIPIGSNPHGLALSADDRTLYVANSGSKSAAIGVLDLATLKTGPSLALLQPPSEVVCGLEGRLYASSKKSGGGIFQVDTTTGTVLSNVTSHGETKARLQISPDHRTLYVYEDELASYDVSTPTIAPLLREATGGYLVESLAGPVLSHDGQLITHPARTNGESVNPIGVYRATSNLTNPIRVLALSKKADTGPQAFSADDQVLYEAEEGLPGYLAAYRTSDFSLLAEVPIFDAVYNDADLGNAVAVDRSNSYVFVAEAGEEPGEVVALATGRGTLTVPNSGSTVTLTGPEGNAPLTIGAQGRYTFIRSGGDLSRTLPVFYTASGEAAQEVNYFLPGLPQPPNGFLPGFIVLAPNVTSVDLVVQAVTSPGDYNQHGTVVTLTLTLAPNPTYQVGNAAQASIDIQLP